MDTVSWRRQRVELGASAHRRVLSVHPCLLAQSRDFRRPLGSAASDSTDQLWVRTCAQCPLGWLCDAHGEPDYGVAVRPRMTTTRKGRTMQRKCIGYLVLLGAVLALSAHAQEVL